MKKLQKIKGLKINIGCGNAKFKGWLNADIEPGADIVLDIRKGLPLNDESVSLIYNEHFIEHLSVEEAERVLRESHRVLQKGGVIRVATPDVDFVIDRYNGNWKDQDWLSWPEYQFIETRGQMLNISFRWWGHQYVYNEEDLVNLLHKTGFNNLVRCAMNESAHLELSGLETREDSKLILEGQKL